MRLIGTRSGHSSLILLVAAACTAFVGGCASRGIDNGMNGVWYDIAVPEPSTLHAFEVTLGGDRGREIESGTFNFTSEGVALQALSDSHVEKMRSLGWIVRGFEIEGGGTRTVLRFERGRTENPRPEDRVCITRMMLLNPDTQTVKGETEVGTRSELARHGGA